MGLVFDAVKKQLEGVEIDVESSGLAALALALASQVDDPDTSSTSKSMNARVLRDVLEQLAKIAPAQAKKDGIDELTERRAARRAAVAAGS